jgi:endonuclease YncB( thermonuclease family)
MKISNLLFLLVPFSALAQTEISGTCHVITADTIHVVGNGNILKVRLGIAAPEPWQRGRHEAKAYLEREEGKPVQCILDGTNAHARGVGICYVGGKDIGASVIKAGLARDCPALSHGRYHAIERPAAQKLDLPFYCEP